MKLCMHLDEFFDVVFKVDKSFIKAASVVLKHRSEYFQAMFSSKSGFKESTDPKIENGGQNSFRIVKIEGVPKVFFNSIIQFLYSGHFYIGQQSLEFFLQLLIYSDYFMLPSLTQACTKHIKQYITCSNVLSVMLLAHAHNAEELETECLDFICLNENVILMSNEWKVFKKAN
jgi:hypothetical protein